MRRTFWALLMIGVGITGQATPALADGFWHRFQLDRFRNTCWPEPFRSRDRELMYDAFTVMKDNGWRIENTLSHSFFHHETQRLTRAGELKIRWIATQTPVHRRTIYVLRGETPEATDIRVATVQDYLANSFPDGAGPDVLLTDIVPTGGSGEYVDQVDRQLKASVPPPRLPSANSGQQSGGSSN